MNGLMKLVNWMENHTWLVRIFFAAWLVMTCILNTVYMGKPVPVTHMILRPWMAYSNCILAGIFTGIMWEVSKPR